MQDSEAQAEHQPEPPHEGARAAPSTESLTELAYRRAREALESALEEARKVRLDALDAARRHREAEAGAMKEALERRRQDGEAEAAGLVRRAEVEAERILAEAQQDARAIVRDAKAEAQRELLEADRTLVEARALRIAADERQREVERLEAEFNATVSGIAERLGITETPERGWLRRLRRR